MISASAETQDKKDGANPLAFVREQKVRTFGG
jgi:hypothetical protein